MSQKAKLNQILDALETEMCEAIVNGLIIQVYPEESIEPGFRSRVDELSKIFDTVVRWCE